MSEARICEIRSVALSDVPVCSLEFDRLTTRQPGCNAAVDPVLHALVVDGLRTDTEICRDIGDASTFRKEIEDLATELTWIVPRHTRPSLLGRQHASPLRQLHQTRGRSVCPSKRVTSSVNLRPWPRGAAVLNEIIIIS